MKHVLMSIAVLVFVASAAAQDSQSLGEAARQNQEQKKAKHTLTNDDVSGSTSTSSAAELSVAPGTLTKSDDADTKAPAETTQAGDDSSADQPKPDRSNMVGDVGFKAEPKDRIETLKQHASQWEAMIANFEKKIADEKNPEKRDSLQLMLEHARQNQAKDAAEQKSLETSEAEKANGQPEAQAGQEQQPTAQPQ